MPRASGWRRPGAVAAGGLVLASVAAVGLGLSVWESGLSRASRGAHWSVALVIAAAFLAALAVGRGRQRRATRSWLVDNAAWIRTWRSQPTPVVVAVVIWTLVIAATVGWDLVSFIVQSHTLPTLSYYIGHVTRYQIGRGVCFGLWLAAGGYLAAGWRARVPQ